MCSENLQRRGPAPGASRRRLTDIARATQNGVGRTDGRTIINDVVGTETQLPASRGAGWS
jgi:hypothetical protein